MSLDNLRVKQQQMQVKAIRKDGKALPVATYSDRDPTTGNRKMIAADGGEISLEWIARSTPKATPPLVAPSTTIGIPGYADQL